MEQNNNGKKNNAGLAVILGIIFVITVAMVVVMTVSVNKYAEKAHEASEALKTEQNQADEEDEKNAGTPAGSVTSEDEEDAQSSGALEDDEQSADASQDENVDMSEEEIDYEDMTLEEGDTALGDTTGIVSTTETDDSADTVVTDVTRVVEKVMPCVVSIFGEYQVDNYFWGQNYSYATEGSGSGFIVGQNEQELLIVTNNHVVEDSTDMTVQFLDESVAPAYIKGTHADMDLAVISVLLQDLDESTLSSISVATLGDSDKLKVGEPAIAIGNALGYGQSVTTGVISALNRSSSFRMGPVNSNDEDGGFALIQTDAAINPGNSGGALLNVRGEVIGINQSKQAETAVEGMGYAIPITTARPIIETLMNRKTKNYGKSTDADQPYMGLTGTALPDSMKEYYGMEFGVYITQVFDDTGAKKAGLKKGDVLTAVGGDAVSGPEDLNSVLSYYDVGDTVSVTYMKRDNGQYTQKTVDVTLGKKR